MPLLQQDVAMTDALQPKNVQQPSLMPSAAAPPSGPVGCSAHAETIDSTAPRSSKVCITAGANKLNVVLACQRDIGYAASCTWMPGSFVIALHHKADCLAIHSLLVVTHSCLCAMRLYSVAVALTPLVMEGVPGGQLYEAQL
eukprot:1139625-Pelagomonas_calceolata.AAC.6